MASSTPSACKTLAWNLAILLIGVIVLYNWYNKNQKEMLAAKDSEIAQSAQALSAKEQELGQAKAAERDLRAEMDALSSRHDKEKEELTGKLDKAGQTARALQDEMKAREEKHTQAIAAEREKAKQRLAKLQGQLDTGKKQIATLTANVEDAKRSLESAAADHQAQMAEAKSAHEAKTLQIERQLKDKIANYRTALEGSDPERAAQLATLEKRAESDQQALEDARQKYENLQAELAKTKSDLSALQRRHDTATARAAEELAATQEQLRSAEADHAKTQANLTAALQETEGRIAKLEEKLRTETATRLALKQKHESKVTELNKTLDSTKQNLADIEAKLRSAEEAAMRAQQAQEKQEAEARSEISRMEASLAQTQRKAEQDLEAAKQEGQESVAYVRNIYTELSKLGGRYTDRGMLLTLPEEELHFKIGKADLPEGEQPNLDWIAQLLIKHPQLTARIEGHTDSKGREETNLELSQQRADAVKQALVARGAPAERMLTEGVGAARPIADNATHAGRRENRRVEIYVLENE